MLQYSVLLGSEDALFSSYAPQERRPSQITLKSVDHQWAVMPRTVNMMQKEKTVIVVVALGVMVAVKKAVMLMFMQMRITVNRHHGNIPR